MKLQIPGVLERIAPSTDDGVPVVFDSPHSGTEYPGDFGHCLSEARLRYAEDAFVDELYAAAPRHGAVLLRALFPRSYIDPNRAPEDLDASMLDGPWPEPLRPGPKTELGIGLIPRREPGGNVYDRKLGVGEVRRRLDRFYWPYHRALCEGLDTLHRRAGAVWHVNCHSMPSISNEVSPEGPGAGRPDFCIGDRDGSTCDPEFTRTVAETLTEMGYRVTINDPYKGVELVRRYSDPARGRHSLQIEANRALYMDEGTYGKVEGFARLQADLTHLVARICEYARSSRVLAEV